MLLFTFIAFVFMNNFEGRGQRRTARLLGVHKETVRRLNKVARLHFKREGERRRKLRISSPPMMSTTFLNLLLRNASITFSFVISSLRENSITSITFFSHTYFI